MTLSQLKNAISAQQKKTESIRRIKAMAIKILRARTRALTRSFEC